jgi:hypothetical protein
MGERKRKRSSAVVPEKKNVGSAKSDKMEGRVKKKERRREEEELKMRKEGVDVVCSFVFAMG